MKKSIQSLSLIFICCFTFAACNTTTPEEYFDLTVLNTNTLVGFANEGQLRELESPSLKMGENKDQTVPMLRSEVINTKIKFMEEDFEKLRKLKETPDTKDMLQTSVALYEYILPVYKNEYRHLAWMYDQGASKEKIHLEAIAVHDKYLASYTQVYRKLITIGKSYAARHSIKVNWAEEN